MIRRIGPWLTPALVAVEVVLVWSGRLGLGAAIGIGLAVEALLWITAVSRVVVGLRRFRAGRAAGGHVWQAAEDGLAALVPRPLARVILVEPRMWVCLVRWVTGHYPRTGFRYDAGLRVLIWTIVGLVVVEGTIVELLLGLVLPGSVWVWVSLGLHLYGLLALLGFLASWATRPHLFDDHGLRLRDGILAELVVPYAAVVGVRAARRPNFGRSGLKINDGAGLLAHGDATVTLTLDPTSPIAVAGRPGSLPLDYMAITADEARKFVDALRARVAATHPSPGGQASP